MDDFTKTVGVGGISGIIGALLSWLKFKYRVDNLQEKVDGLSKEVRYADTCTAMYEGIEKQLNNIVDMQREMRDNLRLFVSQEEKNQ